LPVCLGITVVGTSRFDVAPARDDVFFSAGGKVCSVAGSRRPFRYIRSGQWQADARSFAAVVRYLLETRNPKPNQSGGSPVPSAGHAYQPCFYHPSDAQHFVNAKTSGIPPSAAGAANGPKNGWLTR